MELLRLPGGAVLPVMDASERLAWEATYPIDRDTVYDTDAGALVYYDIDLADFVEIPLGGGSNSPFTLYDDVAEGETDYVNAGLIGATVTKVFRQGLLYRVVTTSPANTMEIQFDTSTGTLTLYSGDAVSEGGEVWCVEYFGVTAIT